MKTIKHLVTAALCAALTAGAANAVPIAFLGSGVGPGGVGVTASAEFDIAGALLTITLRNTSPSNAGTDVPGSTLTGLFFDLTGNPVLTPMSATVPAGSSIVGTQCSLVTCVGLITNVAGEFGYQAAAFSGPLSGADRGIASSGYLTSGLAGNVGNFNGGAAGSNLDNPASLDGINFGIISAAAGFNPNGGLAAVPLIQDRVVFVLSGVAGLSTGDISNVRFQYGTQFNELTVPGNPEPPPSPVDVPEPASALLICLALVSLAASRRAARR